MSSIAEIVLREEYQRSKQHLGQLIKEISSLPKGSIVYKRAIQFCEETSINILK